MKKMKVMSKTDMKPQKSKVVDVEQMQLQKWRMMKILVELDMYLQPILEEEVTSKWMKIYLLRLI